MYDICCCPKRSRDSNGSTGITELRYYLTPLRLSESLYSKLHSAKTKQRKDLISML
jgi:hypothetical protein